MGALTATLVPARRRRRRREVTGLVGRRVAVMVPVLVAISAGVFVLADVSPFDALVGYLGDRYQFATPEQKAAITEALNLDQGWWAAWTSWLSDLGHGNLGHSRGFAMPVAEVVEQRLPWTLLLSAAGLILAVICGLLGGLLTALHPGSHLDRLVQRLAVVVQAVPPFVVALGAVTVGALMLGWFPAGGATPVGGTPTMSSVLRHLALPALVLGISQTPWLLLTVRAEITSALASDAVRAAVARGVPWRRVVTGHVLPPSLAPLATLVGIRLPELIVGAVLVEEVFAWPGLAAALVTSARTLDLPLLAFLTVVSTALVLLASLLADIAYLYLDPRVRADG
ncbi:ABC transporter permease [Granulicoccus sp. GXG6511]|uniref:ABC transporter permease n=1 Tax=Granulicoccus sp. GXG6511 TaxID=3381351 RepID=UPI003D7E1998